MPRPFDQSDAPFSPKGANPRSAHAERPQPLLDAFKVDQITAQRSEGEVTYTVTDLSKLKGQDRRDPPRKRTRLRCGKVLDQNGKFLIECQVYDRSPRGAHLRLIKSVALPRYIKYFDDEQGALLEAEVIWRKKAEVGIQFRTKLNGQAIRSGQRSAAGGKYYAVT